LGLTYLDLYLIHWPIAYKVYYILFFEIINKLILLYKFQEGDDKFPTDANGKMIYSDVDYVDTWAAMEKLVELKLVRSIGLSNFNSQQIERILEVAKIKPAVLQVIFFYLCGAVLAVLKYVQFIFTRSNATRT